MRSRPTSPRWSSKARAASFCAGADLKSLSAALAHPPAPERERSRGGAQRGRRAVFRAVAALPCVTIALVDGAAVGGGMGLACCADIVIATPRARFALTETSLGLPPAQIAPYLVARLGERVARRLALTGARLDGAAAAAIGLADFFSETDGAHGTGGAVEGGSSAARRAPTPRPSGCSRWPAPRRARPISTTAAQSFAAAVRGPEGREGVAAFVEKRAPNWGQA